MINLLKNGRQKKTFKTVFPRYSFHSKRKKSKPKRIEVHISRIIGELLKAENTRINIDDSNKGYYLNNDKKKFNVIILADEHVLKLTNLEINIIEQFNPLYIEGIIRKIIEEKNRRMTGVDHSITENIEKIAESFHNKLKSHHL